MKANKNCLIISGGDYSPISNISNYDFYIACDKGYEYARKMEIMPDVVMGDYDSFAGDINSTVNSDSHANGKAPQIMTFPKEKDDTDTMLAVKHALHMGFERITIGCALGGRMDHTIANMATMLYVATHQGLCEIISSNEHMIMLPADYINSRNANLYSNCRIENNNLILPKRDNCSLSLFAITDSVSKLCINGAKYEVDGVELFNNTSLGASNEWKDEEVIISFIKGILLVIMSKMPD